MDFLHYQLSKKELFLICVNTRWTSYDSPDDAESYCELCDFMMELAKRNYEKSKNFTLSDDEVNYAADVCGWSLGFQPENCIYRELADELLETLSKKCTDFEAYKEMWQNLEDDLYIQ